MSNNRKGAEFFVGLFLLIGLGMIAAMVLIFGRVAQGMQKLYPITVEFPNASGLVKGCDVLISGARVGMVAEAPRLVDEHYAVAVELTINEAVKIPRTSNFQIRTNGMLGDAYIDVVPPRNYTEADYARPGETIAGSKIGGFDELTSKGGELIDRLNAEILTKLAGSLDEIKAATNNLNERLLTEKNLKNVEDTFANLKEASAEFKKASKDLDGVMSKAGEAIDSVKTTMKTADTSAVELKLALGDLRKTADTATKTIESAKGLIQKAAAGEGTFGRLVSDPQMGADLKALISNMRRSGVLFYKDRVVTPATPSPTPVPPTTRKRR
jgi:phospholipid/cholesterol/gamma-HCH transport system substrate-binding protein